MQISDSSSRILAGLLEARTGQQLTMSRRWRIETALSALLRERGISTLDELITILVMNKEPGLSNRVVEALLNNETYFFRDRTPFDTLAKNALPALAREARVEEAAPHLVGWLLDGSGSLFARYAVRRRGGEMAGLDDRHPRHRRFELRHRSRAGRALHPVRGSAGPGDHADGSLVRGMPGRLAHRRAAAQERPLPGPQSAGDAAASGRLRHRPLPQRPALSLRREEGARLRPPASRRWPTTAISCWAPERR